jgi:hypothetical protein
MNSIKTAVIAAAAVAAGVIFAPGANADQSDFLTTMDALDLHNTLGADAALHNGYRICALLNAGYSEQAVTQSLFDHSGGDDGFTRADAYDVVRAASNTLC